MQDLVSKLVQEGAVITGAPISFVTSVILVCLFVWAVVNWFYNRAFTNKNTQIDLLNGRLADYQEKLKGATPDQAAGEIAHLRAEIEGIKNPPRDDNSVYRKGRRIGMVAGVAVDAKNNRVSFARMTIDGVLDEATNIEFRNLTLAFSGSEGVGRNTQGLAVNSTYTNAKFKIVGDRH
jgi:hypothetical protein